MNRKGINKEMKKEPLKEQQHKSYENENLMLVKYLDKKVISLISTIRDFSSTTQFKYD